MGMVDVMPGYRITAPYELEQSILGYKTLLPSSSASIFMAICLFTHQRLIDHIPDAIERFSRATKQGLGLLLTNG